MKILILGDIVGQPGRRVIKEVIRRLKEEEDIELVIANAENAAGGSGITPPVAEELFSSGIHLLTSGDHIWKKKEVIPLLEREKRILRPANYPPGVPGRGSTLIKTSAGELVGVINLVGRVFMAPVECPFRLVKEEIKKLKEETSVIIVDMHAEATSEKLALAWYVDGAVSAVLGTHTHVQTADERIFPQGTAYITDLGMTGPFYSILGRKSEQIIERFVLQMSTRFNLAGGEVLACGVIVDINSKTGKARSIKRIQERIL